MHFLLFGLSAFALEPCPTLFTLEDLQDSLSLWSKGIVKQNIPQVKEGEELSGKNLSCLKDPINKKLAFELHMLNGVMLWIGQSKDESKLAFSAAKYADPMGAISFDLFPEGHIIHSVFSEAPPIRLADPIKVPFGTSVYFDGHKDNQRPMGIPTIYQLSQANKIIVTQYLAADEVLPQVELQSRFYINRPLIYSAIGGALLSSGLFLRARVLKSNYYNIADNNPTQSDIDILERLYQENQFYSRAAIATTGVSVLIGVGAFFINW